MCLLGQRSVRDHIRCIIFLNIFIDHHIILPNRLALYLLIMSSLQSQLQALYISTLWELIYSFEGKFHLNQTFSPLKLLFHRIHIWRYSLILVKRFRSLALLRRVELHRCHQMLLLYFLSLLVWFGLKCRQNGIELRLLLKRRPRTPCAQMQQPKLATRYVPMRLIKLALRITNLLLHKLYSLAIIWLIKSRIYQMTLILLLKFSNASFNLRLPPRLSQALTWLALLYDCRLHCDELLNEFTISNN